MRRRFEDPVVEKVEENQRVSGVYSFWSLVYLLAGGLSLGLFAICFVMYDAFFYYCYSFLVGLSPPRYIMAHVTAPSFPPSSSP